jgi:hypothetical protein
MGGCVAVNFGRDAGKEELPVGYRGEIAPDLVAIRLLKFAAKSEAGISSHSCNNRRSAQRR